MTDYEKEGYVIVKGFLDAQAVDTVSRYLENAVNRYPQNNLSQNGISRFAFYADPLTEVILRNALPDVEAVTNLALYPTYSFARVYQKGDELRPHNDRPSCEVSVTCNIATKGERWPIYMKAPGKETAMHYLEPGDACVYKGCEVKHWRDKAVDTDINVQVMLHYVNKDGPNAGYKFDEREALGLRNKWS